MNCMYRTLLAAVALAVSSVTASAETITVCASGCDYTDLQEAIDAAGDGDIVRIDSDLVFVHSQIQVVAKSITISGPMNGFAVLDGRAMKNEPAVLFESSGVSGVIQNLVFQNVGHFAVRCDSNSSPLFRRCSFDSNVSGVQAVNGSSPRFFDCEFTNNRTNGGAFLASAIEFGSNSDGAVVEQCRFSNNTALPYLNYEVSTVFLLGNPMVTIKDSAFCENAPRDASGPWQDGGGNSFSLSCEVSCTGDLNLDHVVNAADLGIMIAVWGTNGSVVEGSDINGDGTVSAADLGLLIGAWGPCQ